MNLTDAYQMLALVVAGALAALAGCVWVLRRLWP